MEQPCTWPRNELQVLLLRESSTNARGRAKALLIEVFGEKLVLENYVAEADAAGDPISHLGRTPALALDIDFVCLFTFLFGSETLLALTNGQQAQEASVASLEMGMAEDVCRGRRRPFGERGAGVPPDTQAMSKQHLQSPVFCLEQDWPFSR